MPEFYLLLDMFLSSFLDVDIFLHEEEAFLLNVDGFVLVMATSLNFEPEDISGVGRNSFSIYEDGWITLIALVLKQNL